MPDTYVEVPRLQTHADKIDSQLSVVLARKPHMYDKTKKRYKELAITLLASVEKIAAILEEDSLASVDNVASEFDSATFDVSDLASALQHTSDKINSYTSFVSNDLSSVSTNANKETLRRYGKVLEQAANYNFSCVEANECAFILNRWFTSRFSNPSKDSTFKYNMAYIPGWITDIIILYGKYHSNQDTQSFMNMMVDWCDKLATQSIRWAVPYEVYNLGKQVEPTDYTMDAVLVGDILMDEMLYQLTDTSSPDIVANLECYPVASKVKAGNPSLLPVIRTRLVKRDALMKEYNLTTTERRR